MMQGMCSVIHLTDPHPKLFRGRRQLPYCVKLFLMMTTAPFKVTQGHQFWHR